MSRWCALAWKTVGSLLKRPTRGAREPNPGDLWNYFRTTCRLCNFAASNLCSGAFTVSAKNSICNMSDPGLRRGLFCRVLTMP
jgi:hypothetical protein